MGVPVMISTCGCGASIQAPCSAEEINAVHMSFQAQGWGYDAHGFVRCPECMKLPDGAPAPRETPPKPKPAQGSLF